MPAREPKITKAAPRVKRSVCLPRRRAGWPGSAVLLWLACGLPLPAGAQPPQQGSAEALESGEFRWRLGPPLLAVQQERLPASPGNSWHAVKDPSIVRHGGQWHLFCTLRKERCADGRPRGCIRIGYLAFADWGDAPRSTWRLLALSQDYHGAPQVFYFAPQRKWYLVCQLEDQARGIAYGPCYATNDDVANPLGWSPPAPFYQRKPPHVPGWLDFWVICDDERAHLFFTSLDGRMWRADTPLADFPQGFGNPVVALAGDVFEASHTYRLQGLDKYLTVIEAQGASGGRGERYYKAYLADRLEGAWRELAATAERPFAGSANVRAEPPCWTDSFSHGELLRAGHDQRLEVDPRRLRFLFQGASDEEYARGAWRLGLLEGLAGEAGPREE